MNILNLINTSMIKNEILNSVGKEFTDRISSELQINKIETVLKLVYRLFLYSIIGFFAKIVSFIFKF